MEVGTLKRKVCENSTYNLTFFTKRRRGGLAAPQYVEYISRDSGGANGGNRTREFNPFSR